MSRSVPSPLRSRVVVLMYDRNLVARGDLSREIDRFKKKVEHAKRGLVK
jgi:hypothetical protein